MSTYQYGATSLKRLATVDDSLQKVFHQVIRLGLIDISIIYGVRSKDLQNRYFAEGKSKVRWPDSKHNIINRGDRAKAVDAGPFVGGAVSYNYNHCCFLAGIVLAVASEMGVVIRWGGNWDMDGEPITDQDFQDLVHYELIN